MCNTSISLGASPTRGRHRGDVSPLRGEFGATDHSPRDRTAEPSRSRLSGRSSGTQWHPGLILIDYRTDLTNRETTYIVVLVKHRDPHRGLWKEDTALTSPVGNQQCLVTIQVRLSTRQTALRSDADIQYAVSETENRRQRPTATDRGVRTRSGRHPYPSRRDRRSRSRRRP
jgi:hypothetical protein